MARKLLSLAGGGSLTSACLPAVTVGLFVTVIILVVLLCVKRKVSNKDRGGEELEAAAEAGARGRKTDAGDRVRFGYGEEDGFGEGGLWQKSILLGDKCRPLEFSGVIYYDDSGNQVAELPRSPNLAPVTAASPIRNFTFPMGSATKASY